MGIIDGLSDGAIRAHLRAAEKHYIQLRRLVAADGGKPTVAIKAGGIPLIPSVMAGSAAKIARRTASSVGFSGCVILATCAVTPGLSSCSRQKDAEAAPRFAPLA